MIRAEAYRIRRKKGYANKIWAVLRILLLAFIILSVLRSMLLGSVLIGSDSNKPSLTRGDRLMTSPLVYGAVVPFTKLRLSGIVQPKRGDLVVFDIKKNTPNFPFTFFNELLSFFSFGLLGRPLDSRGKVINSLQVKRIIAQPGDEIYMDRFRAYVKTPDSADFIEESQLMDKTYPINITEDHFISEWNQDFPFSGNRTTMTLGDNQYFLLGDNRMASLDSLSLGPVEKDQIVSKVLLKFWPLTKIGLF